MNYEEYLQKVTELESEFKNKKLELMKDFVRANNPYKIGDKITDHIGSIIIEKIGFAWGWGYSVGKPCATYTGLELKKDGTPTKKESRRQVWQSDIKQ
jgi:hypothetical protein